MYDPHVYRFGGACEGQGASVRTKYNGGRTKCTRTSFVLHILWVGILPTYDYFIDVC